VNFTSFTFVLHFGIIEVNLSPVIKSFYTHNKMEV